MSDAPESFPVPGTVSWFDLTVDDADPIRKFYEEVTGWTNEPVDMGGYKDHCMVASDGATVAGICHAKGSNAGIPPVWIIYVQVDDIAATVDKCIANGGEVIQGARNAGGGTMAILKDPAGACFGVYASRKS